MNLLNGLRLVVIDNPKASWEDPIMQQLLMKIWSLKFRGFGSKHGDQTLPVDATDFVSTHVAYCIDRDANGFEPILAYRSISLDRCLLHKIPFPGLALAQSSGAPEHEALLREEIRDHDPKFIRYCSSYTISPEARQDAQTSLELKEIMGGGHRLFIDSTGATLSLLAGVIRFKVDKMFESWGYVPLSRGGYQLPPINQYSLSGDAVNMMKLEAWTPRVIQCSKRIAFMWKNRIAIPSTAAETSIKKTA